MPTQTLNIGPGSDGDGRKWPKHHYNRNDDYYLDRIAADWINDLPGGPQPGVTYRLNRLPAGYAGFERSRPDSKHVDRYIYGHPSGQFRSLTEFYPHFKHLMEVGGSAGCECIKCAGNARKPKDLPERRSKYFPQSEGSSASVPFGPLISPMRAAGMFKKGRSSPEDDLPPKRKDVDVEGTPDVYERLILRLKDAGPDVTLDEHIEEKMSPDWCAANSQLKTTLKTLRGLPRYVPRIGELVMFVRKLDEGERLAWDKGGDAFKRVDVKSKTWRDAPKWEVGVVTQMPQEEITEQDLVSDLHKQQSIIYSGFKIEPVSEPGNEAKPHTRQYKHVSLHAIRPFALWQDCLRGRSEAEWHPTVKHALTVSSSLCPVGRYRFRGTWPNASVFCRGLYMGSELIIPGDTVRLLPKSGEQSDTTVTEVMVIETLRLRFVNLDFDEDDLAPTAPALPYQTSVHVSGKVFTTDPSRSFNGVTKRPIDPNAGVLPSDIQDYGPWYHYLDPNNPAARIDIPFSRILGRCHEHSAMKSLFTSPTDVKTEMQPPAFKAANAPKVPSEPATATLDPLSKGLSAIKDARKHSEEHDARLTSTEQPWFFADTRIEQLDLHEVNGRYVGARDPMRTKEQLSRWQKMLKGMAGKPGALAEYEAARRESVELERAALQSKGGMMGRAAVDTEMESTANGDSAGLDEEDDDDDDDGMEVDDTGEANEAVEGGAEETAGPLQPPTETIDLMDSEDEEEIAQDEQVGELYKNIRPGGRG